MVALKPTSRRNKSNNKLNYIGKAVRLLDRVDTLLVSKLTFPHKCYNLFNYFINLKIFSIIVFV